MGKHARRPSPAFLLTVMVPLIPVLALFTVPHPPSPECGPPECLAFTPGASPFHISAPLTVPRPAGVRRTVLTADVARRGTR